MFYRCPEMVFWERQRRGIFLYFWQQGNHLRHGGGYLYSTLISNLLFDGYYFFCTAEICNEFQKV